MLPHIFALPHQILQLSEGDLALGREEVAELANVADHRLDRLMQVTRGWPLCVRLVLRLATQGDLDEVFDRLDSVAFENLYDYLITHVIDALDERSRELIVILSSFDASERDLRRLFPDEPRIMIAAARRSPFVEEISGSFRIHPLIRQSVRSRYQEDADRISALAAELALKEEPVRAARLYADRQEFEKAAAALEGQALYLSTEPRDPDFAEVLAQLPRSLLLRHPALASSIAQFCGLTFSNEERLVYQLQAFQQTAHLENDAPARLATIMSVVNALSNLGRHSEALEFAADIPHLDTPTARLYTSMMGMVRARMGIFSRASLDYAAVLAQAPESFTGLAISTYELLSKPLRAKGEFAKEIESLERAFAYAAMSGNRMVVTLVLIEMCFGAWFRGADAEFARAVSLFEQARSPLTEPGTRLFASCLRGGAADLRPDVARAQIHAYAYLIALSVCPQDRARGVATLAVFSADASGEPFLSCIARIAHSLVDSSSAGRMLYEARGYAESVESPALQVAVKALTGGEVYPILAGLRARVLGGTVDSDRYALSHFSGSFYLGLGRLSPTPREMELLCYLGFREGAVSSDELAEALVPSWNSREASGMLRVCVSRIRKKFGREVVVSTEKGYELGPRVDVALRQLRTRLRAAEARTGALLDEDLLLERDIAAIERAVAPPAWEWAHEYVAEIQSLQERAKRLRGIGPIVSQRG